MIDFVVGAIVLAAVGFAVAYIIKAKKNGIQCIGCPDAKYCSSAMHTGKTACGGCDGTSCAGCGCHTEGK